MKFEVTPVQLLSRIKIDAQQNIDSIPPKTCSPTDRKNSNDSFLNYYGTMGVISRFLLDEPRQGNIVISRKAFMNSLTIFQAASQLSF